MRYIIRCLLFPWYLFTVIVTTIVWATDLDHRSWKQTWLNEFYFK